ncbi:MAG: LVIVD repeat-containing protein [Gemmatimonadaceae bacterium]
MRIAVPTLAAALTLAPALAAQTYPSANDPRNGLQPGLHEAGVASRNMRLVSTTPKPAALDSMRGLAFVNSDLAFGGNYVYQGNFAGFSIWDVSRPAQPALVAAVECITSQGDPSVYGNLLFISAEGAGNRTDCAKGGVSEPSEHMAGVRIYDVSNPRQPRLVKNVQTCKGSHTHTLVPSPTDKGVVYVYVSGNQGARPETELAGCRNAADPADETNSLYRLDVIKVPLARPQDAEVVTGARIFTELKPAPRRAGANRPPRGISGADSAMIAAMLASGPRNCHDVTAYPAMGLLAGACASYGLLVDISNPERPVRLDAVSDTNFSLWHTAVFSNDGKKVVFTDEWGGGTSPNCQAMHPLEMGGNTILTIGADRKLTQHAYFKIPSAQSPQENCVSHNGSLVPVPGRDIMVQGWYQGGVDVIDFTDPDHPVEIGFFDRGPVDAPPAAGSADSGVVSRTRGTIAGSWGAYWYNGLVYSSEMARGLDILELTPSDQLSANEIAAAKLVRMSEFNPQSQPRVVWPAAFPVVRSYLDQLVRGNGLAAARTSAIGRALDAAERQSGAARRAALTRLAAQVDADARGASDAARVRAMAAAIRDLAAATR